MKLIKYCCYFVNLENDGILQFDNLMTNPCPSPSRLYFLSFVPILLLSPCFTFILGELCQGMIWPLVFAHGIPGENI